MSMANEPDLSDATAMRSQPIEYADFELQLWPTREMLANPDLCSYRVQSRSSLGYRRHRIVRLSREEQRMLQERFHNPLATLSVASRPEERAAQALGSWLHEKILSKEVRECYVACRETARHRGLGLRIRLFLSEVAELATLPWEYLFDGTGARFLATEPRTSIVRDVELLEPVNPLEITPPLRVLVMVSSPRNYTKLDAEGEWQTLERELADLRAKGLVEIERLPKANLDSLQQRLRHQPPVHVLHFIGHGDYSEADQGGILILEDKHGNGAMVSGSKLAMLLYQYDPLRLVLLNSCKGAFADSQDTFSGTAQQLVQQGIPAVIAMQFNITDEAAKRLSSGFYAALADGLPVDTCLTEARRAISSQGSIEWGAPALYMRTQDGRIFDIEKVLEAGPSGSHPYLNELKKITELVELNQDEEAVRIIDQLRLWRLEKPRDELTAIQNRLARHRSDRRQRLHPVDLRNSIQTFVRLLRSTR